MLKTAHLIRCSYVAAVLAVAGMTACSKPAGPDQPEPPTPEEPGEPASCRPTGCSGQVCAAEDVTTDCLFRPEYACYQSATCEAQAGGECGWTMTPELEACLASPPGGDAGAAESPEGAPDESVPAESAPE